MVEEPHRRRVLKFLDCFYSGDLEGALACCSDDIDFVAHAPVDLLPHMGPRRGKAAVAEMWRTVHSHYSSMRHEVPMIVAEADKVAALIRLFFRKQDSERMMQFTIADFYTLRDGRIMRISQFLDTFDVVQQLLDRDIAGDLAGDGPGRR